MQSHRPSNAPSRRRHERITAHVTARWHNRSEEDVAAVILDVSTDGLFLVPEGSMPESVGNGSLVWVVVPSSGRTETLAGTVRWKGFHPRHAVSGFGIQVEGPSLELVLQAFPFLQSADERA